MVEYYPGRQLVGAKGSGASVDGAIKVLPGSRQIDASWSASTNNVVRWKVLSMYFAVMDLAQDLRVLVSSRKEHLFKVSLVMLMVN